MSVARLWPILCPLAITTSTPSTTTIHPGTIFSRLQQEEAVSVTQMLLPIVPRVPVLVLVTFQAWPDVMEPNPTVGALENLMWTVPTMHSVALMAAETLATIQVWFSALFSYFSMTYMNNYKQFPLTLTRLWQH